MEIPVALVGEPKFAKTGMVIDACAMYPSAMQHVWTIDFDFEGGDQ